MATGAAWVVAATSISAELAPLVATGAEMRVHSVFDRAANLMFMGRPPGWLPLGMMTVAHEPLGNLPQGILVPAAVGPLRRLARVGQGVSLEGGRLRLGDGAIDLGEAPSWDPSLDAVRARLWDAAWRERWSAAWRALESDVSQASMNPLWGVASDKVERLMAALAKRELGRAIDAAEQIVGLGPGLTPSGDDLLTGLMIGLRCLPAGRGSVGFVQAWAEGVRALAGRTTDVSRVYLEWAARGRATERLRNVADAIVWAPTGDHLAGAVSAALQVGSTSGADGLLGLLLGLRLWIDESEEDHANVA